MSRVLERMAKRALGALPTIQPLTAPHYARPAEGLRESTLELETNVELEPHASRIESRRPANQQTQTRVAENHPSGYLEDRGASLAPDPAQPATRAETRRTQNRAPTATPASDERARLAQPEHKADAGTTPSVNKEPVQEPESGAVTRGRANAFTRRDSRMDLDQNVVFEPIEAAEPEFQTPTPASTFKQEEDSRRESAVILSAPDRNRPAGRAQPSTRRQSAAPLEQKTEIHISIGSIELRTPRVETRQPAAPFRPQVTLEDFLRRKPEAGA